MKSGFRLSQRFGKSNMKVYFSGETEDVPEEYSSHLEMLDGAVPSVGSWRLMVIRGARCIDVYEDGQAEPSIVYRVKSRRGRAEVKRLSGTVAARIMFERLLKMQGIREGMPCAPAPSLSALDYLSKRRVY